MIRAKTKSAMKRPKYRSSWKGNLTFGLVSFPVQAINAVNREQSDIHFHQLHNECHSRISYRKVCPIHGEVPSEEIVSGYEYKKGQYVEIEPDELDAFRTSRERALTIDAFVEPDAIDPIYFDGRMYYLLPAGAGADEPYVVLAEAMEREERYGVGQVVFSGKEQVVLVRPVDGVLHMAMLNYDAELRPAEEMVAQVAKPRGAQRKVELAQTLIRNWSPRDFDFTAYQDRYREKVKDLIEAKIAGREIVQPEAEEVPEEVVNLMDALKQSIARTTTANRREDRPRKRRRPA